MMGYSIPSFVVSRFWFHEAGMIIPCKEGIAPNVELASMRWNLALSDFGLIAFTDSLLSSPRVPAEEVSEALDQRMGSDLR